ncbi:MAG: cyclic nucleotide-binding domain-containing protein, partial [Candidatus Eutrophobiaceae bacterium]
KKPLDPKDPAILKAIPLFQGLSGKEISIVLNSPECYATEHLAKDLVVREGEVGNCMYIILKGRLQVLIRQHSGANKAIAFLEEGDFFGEEALFPWSDGVRNASVQVSSNTAQILQVGKKHVMLALQRGIQLLCSSKAFKNDVNLADLSNIKTQDNSAEEEEENDPLEWHLGEKRKIHEIFSNSRFAKTLSKTEITYYEDGLSLERREAEEVILRAKVQLKHCYLIAKGRVDALFTNSAGASVVIAQLKEGDLLGEKNLLPNNGEKYASSTRAKTDIILIKIDAQLFSIVMKRDRLLLMHIIKENEKWKALAKKFAGANT